MKKRLKKILIIAGVILVIAIGSLVVFRSFLDPSANKQRPSADKYAEMSRRITDNAGSTDVASIDIQGNRLLLVVRNNGVDSRWTMYPDFNQPKQETSTDLHETNSTIKASSIDWNKIHKHINQIDKKCYFPTYGLDVLFFGQLYERTGCQNSTKLDKLTIDDKDLPAYINADNAEGYASFMRLLSLVLPESKVHRLQKSLSDEKNSDGFYAEGPQVTLANGKKAYLRIGYTERGGTYPLTINAIDELQQSDNSPTLMFNPNDYNPQNYIDALNAGLAKAPFPREKALDIGFTMSDNGSLKYVISGLAKDTTTGKLYPAISSGIVNK